MSVLLGSKNRIVKTNLSDMTLTCAGTTMLRWMRGGGNLIAKDDDAEFQCLLLDFNIGLIC